jgi:hypothetical protein
VAVSDKRTSLATLGLMKVVNSFLYYRSLSGFSIYYIHQQFSLKTFQKLFSPFKICFCVFLKENRIIFMKFMKSLSVLTNEGRAVAEVSTHEPKFEGLNPGAVCNRGLYFGTKTLSIMTLSIMTLSIKPLSITTSA